MLIFFSPHLPTPAMPATPCDTLPQYFACQHIAVAALDAARRAYIILRYFDIACRFTPCLIRYDIAAAAARRCRYDIFVVPLRRYAPPRFH